MSSKFGTVELDEDVGGVGGTGKWTSYPVRAHAMLQNQYLAAMIWVAFMLMCSWWKDVTVKDKSVPSCIEVSGTSSDHRSIA